MSYPGDTKAQLTNPTGVAAWPRTVGRNPVGVENIWDGLSQGSSFLATLGFVTESLWDFLSGRRNVWLMIGPKERFQWKIEAAGNPVHEMPRHASVVSAGVGTHSNAAFSCGLTLILASALTTSAATISVTDSITRAIADAHDGDTVLVSSPAVC
jgi:hypothetical protein